MTKKTSYDSSYKECTPTIYGKETPLRTFLHYSDPDAKTVLTVFGKERKGLFYNYDDRLPYDKWHKGLELAKEQAPVDSARYFEIALANVHGTECNIEHIQLGCNASNGFSYLVFGYTYDSAKAKNE